jgi:ABC-type antimicrobial peptide transport system permease subunit
MLKNYFKIALRNLIRYKVYSFINIFGLVIGMACAILILLWVQDEVSYDNFHKQANNICKIYVKIILSNKTVTTDHTFAAVASDLKATYPEILNSAKVTEINEFILKATGVDNQNQNAVFSEKKGMAADPSFLQIFSFQMLKGNPQTVLENPNSIVITEEMSKKYFGDLDAVGKTITINNRYDVTVAGILKNIPFNSHIRFDFLVPLKFMENYGYNLNNYNSTSIITYLLLNNAASVQELNKKIQQEFDKTIPVKDIKFEHSIVTLPRVHLYGDESFPKIIFVYVLAGLAVLILLIACINFINLSTARSMVRSKEIGVRKVIGASVSQIVFMLTEDLTKWIILANIIAWPVAYYFMNQWLQNFAYRIDISWWIFVFSGGIALVIALVTVSFQAIKAAVANPIESLRYE